MSAHNSLTGAAVGSMTSVMRSSDDWRVNSTGARGPSWNHSRWIGSAPGFQINDPHPRQAIFIGLIESD